MSRPRFIGLLLALLALVVYQPAARHGFILYDDGDYVTENPMVRDGLTLAGIKWAFTTFHSANWHPLTWISHMVDSELFGLNPAGPHFVNVFLHAANTVLVFALWLLLWRRRLRQGEMNQGLVPRPDGDRPHPGPLPQERENSRPMVGYETHRIDSKQPSENRDDAIWAAAFIAALFAVHPLHVESVAWVAERKDVLSTFFGLVALVCYVLSLKSTVHSPQSEISPESIGHGPWSRPVFYALALFFFALGLMSKPMLVTWPFVMLLLDYWPLQRFNRSTLQRLFTEKIPFFALTAASCVVTYIAQNQGAVRSLAAVPLAYRLESVPVALATYLFKSFWPARLAVIYPMPHAIPAAAFIGCSLLLIAITAGAWIVRKQHPFLLVGWFWFLGTLVPVIGLVKVGDAAMADRYMYIPSIGIFMIVAVGATGIWKRFPMPKGFLSVPAVIILVVLTMATERQLQFWRNDDALFGHAVSVTSDNVDAIVNYGVALENEGKPQEAIVQYRQAEQLAPSSAIASANLADLLYYTGETNSALEQYRQAVKLQPASSTLHDRLGTVLSGLGDFAEATNEFWRAIDLDRNDSAPHSHLGMALAKHDDLRDATNEFVQALRLSPGDSSPLVGWAQALLREGRDAEAMEQLNQALQMDPDNFQTLAFAARVLASDKRSEIRNGTHALDLAKRAQELSGGAQPLVLDVLGMACAENGQFDEAQKAVVDAIRLAKAVGMKKEIIEAMEKRKELYTEHQPWRESWQ